jgi:chromosome segregation ATPase
MSDDEYTQLNVRVPRDAKEQASKKLPHGGLTQAVRDRIEEIAYGKPTTREQALAERIQSLRDDRRELVAERDHLNDQIDNLDHKLDRLERELQTLDE